MFSAGGDLGDEGLFILAESLVDNQVVVRFLLLFFPLGHLQEG